MRRVSIALAGLVLAGCRNAPSPPPTVWFTPKEPYRAVESSANGFDDLVLAAEAMKRDDEVGMTRGSFTPMQRKNSLAAGSRAYSLLIRGVNKPCTFQFSPCFPNQSSPYAAAWRQLGRLGVWKIEDAAAAKDSSALITNVRVMTKFAQVIMHGDAIDADLAMTILDDTRKALVPSLPLMSDSELNAIADALTPIVKDKEWLADASSHERENMLAAVQFVQDTAYGKKWDDLKRLMGDDYEEPQDYLQDLMGKDSGKQADYFRKFAAEIDEETRIVSDALETPASIRKEMEIPSGARPWKRYAKHFFRGLRPLVERYDFTYTRTKLLLLNCRILAKIKATGKAPISLSAYGADLALDPFTGKPFGYISFESDFRLYSLGEDGRDNGGSSNEEYSAPDVTLETGTGAVH